MAYRSNGLNYVVYTQRSNILVLIPRQGEIPETMSFGRIRGLWDEPTGSRYHYVIGLIGAPLFRRALKP